MQLITGYRIFEGRYIKTNLQTVLSFKLNQLKFKNNKFKNLEKANAKLVSEIKQLNEKLNFKELQIKETSKELTELQKEMENLYRVVDVKEREERSTAIQLQANIKEHNAQKEQTKAAIQMNNENLIRLENVNVTLVNLLEEKMMLKSEILNWRKYTVIAVVTLFVILILFVVKLII